MYCLSFSLSSSLFATSLEEPQDTADSQDPEYPDKSEDCGRGELGIGLWNAQLEDDVAEGHGQDQQVKQVPFAQEIVLPESYYLHTHSGRSKY